MWRTGAALFSARTRKGFSPLHGPRLAPGQMQAHPATSREARRASSRRRIVPRCARVRRVADGSICRMIRSLSRALILAAAGALAGGISTACWYAWAPGWTLDFERDLPPVVRGLYPLER